MNEKGPDGVLDHNEKPVLDTNERSSSEVHEEVAGGLGRRRKSVALNIVENPLTVSILPDAWKTLALADMSIEEISRTNC